VQSSDLVCIRCHGALHSTTVELRCVDCGAAYPFVGGVPVLLPSTLSGQQLAQAAYFDAEFSVYERYQPERWRASYIRRIFSALGIAGTSGGPYLDVGVGGSGATVIEAARRGVEATGCDLSLEGVRRAERFARAEGVAERARFVACAAESLPFRDGTFGCASAVAVLEHLEDDAAAACELARVVRPGGLVWITVPLAYRYVLPPFWPIYLWHDRKLGHLRHYDEAALVALARNAGLRHVETSYTGHAVKIVQLLLDRLLLLSAERRSSLWWKLERLDLRATHRPWGALQLNVVLARAI